MPSAFTHAVVGFGLVEMAPFPDKGPAFYGLSMALAAAPDLDVIGFYCGIEYRSFWGHRGFVHSLLFALLSGLGLGLLFGGSFVIPWWQLGLFLFIVIASHGVLDGFTNGGLGIAYFSPFDTGRYFFPWQPIQVSPLGMAFFGPWGLRVMKSEIMWVWLPLGMVIGGVLLYRSSA